MVNLGKRNTVFSVGMYKNVKNRFTGFLCSASTLPRTKYPIKTGTKVIASAAEAAIAYVLVNASGENILPSCASSVNTGTKLTVMINKLKNSAGPTSDAESMTTCHRFSFVRGVRSICLCMFSIMTMAPSLIAPIAIAIPPKDMMFALIPCMYITMIAVMIPTGILTIATSDERT